MLKKLNKKNEQTGFTIIEVVLVLAIAGLIFVVVFLALPQLQRSRRDTQRRSDAGRVLAELENYAGNNNGAYPTSTTACGAVATNGDFANFDDRYLSDFDLADPAEGDYLYECNDTAAYDPPVGTIQYASSSICDGEGIDIAGSDRNVSIRIALESGNTFYCQDNE